MLLKKYFLKLISLSFVLFFLQQDFYGQFSYFGRNKVHYEKFNWQVLKTDHFDIYFYPEFTEIAEIGARYAEEAYEELKIKFNYVVLQKIPLIFYNTSIHFQQTNTVPGLLPEGVGGFFEFLKGRVVLPYDGSLEQFKHVIRHELVHVFMTNKIKRIQKDFRLTTDLLPPLWFVEGLAEYWSTNWDAQAEMILRDAVLQGYIVGLNDIEKTYGSFLMYKIGQKILYFVSEKFGEEKILELFDNYWKSSDFEDVWKLTLGIDYKEFDREWKYYLKKTYYPLLYNRELPTFVSRKITEGGFNFSPVYYKNKSGEWIYFLANRDGYGSIHRINLSDSKSQKPELIIQGEKSDEFESFHLFRNRIAISTDGKLVFSAKSGGSDQLIVFDVEQNVIIKKIADNEIIKISDPAFTNDGTKLIFSGIDKKGYSDLFLYDFSNDKITRLTNDYFDDRQPVFYSNNLIVFSSDRSTDGKTKFYNLFFLNIDELIISPLTSLKANFNSPVFTQDYKFLLFTSDLDGVNNIWAIKNISPNTIKQQFEDSLFQVTNYLTSAFDLNINSDSTIFFSCFENFSFQIYSVNGLENLISHSKEKCVSRVEGIFNYWFELGIDGEKVKQKLKYEREYTLDIAQSHIATNPVYGTSGGALVSLSDMLSDDYYQFLIFNTAQSKDEFLKSFNVAISKVSLAQRTNYAYGVFHFSGRRYDLRDLDEYFFERNFGVFFSLSYPLSFFRRIEASFSLANSDKEAFFTLRNRKALLLTNILAYVFDNSLWASSGPIDGSRLLILLSQTNDIKFSNVNYYSFMFDYRYYLRIGLRSAFATRFQLFFNEGKESRRYFMGGNWDLRGYPRWSIRGEKLWLTSFELRFPLIDQITVRFPFLTMNLFEFRGAIFMDMGNAWDTKYEETLGSVGFGIKMNLLNALVLRYDIGKKIEPGIKKFQKGLFYQFFFGWDF